MLCSQTLRIVKFPPRRNRVSITAGHFKCTFPVVVTAPFFLKGPYSLEDEWAGTVLANCVEFLCNLHRKDTVKASGFPFVVGTLSATLMGIKCT